MEATLCIRRCPEGEDVPYAVCKWRRNGKSCEILTLGSWRAVPIMAGLPYTERFIVGLHPPSRSFGI